MTQCGYVYEQERSALFTDDGQRMFIKFRDAAKELLKEAGAFRMQELMNKSHCGGSSFTMVACVDRLVELGEVVELTPHPKVFEVGQNRVFTDGGIRP
jgi:hypothetical protein